ncbi:MAG: hypothetical protein ACKOBP_09060, partial [Planctomycetia bacterium]
MIKARLATARPRTLFGVALVAGILAALALELCSASAWGATPAPPSLQSDGLQAAGLQGVERIDDYSAATAAAQTAGAMLLVSVEPASGVPDDVAGAWLERADVQARFAGSGRPWVFCRLGMEAGGAALVGDPALVEMRRGPGVFVVD